MEMSEESEGGRGSSFKPFIKSLFSYLTTSSFDRKKSNSQSKDEVEDRNVSLPLPPGLVRSRPNREVFWSCLRNRCAKSLRATRVMAWLDGRKKSDHWWDFLEGGGVIAATGGSTFGSSKDETRGMVTRGKVKSQGKRPGFDVEEEEEVTGNVKEKEEKEEEEEGGSAEALVYLGEIMMECRVRWNWIKLVILRSGLEGAAALKSLHDGKGGEEEVKILGTLEQFGDHVEDEIRDSNELLARLNKLRMDCERKGKVGRRKGRGGGFFRRNPEGSLSEGEEEREEEGEGEGDGEEMNLLKGFDTSMKRIGEGVESLRGILDSIGMLTSVLGDGKEHVGEVEPEAGGEGLGEGEDGKERVKVEEGGGSDDGDSQDEESESLTPALRCSSSSEVSFLCSQ
ncbi:hypothetical protein IE53DRAFT_78695 [Violaceomyces palustris]|uniref:Uncharacterized protein n=1 Tax=Violaceomyces palustris TaxID=1673888 RepID=A0ACD0NY18_9BASI|nr:hypothetical protein IE53DRAFT_78695 [Violaceomyces palustris]